MRTPLFILNSQYDSVLLEFAHGIMCRPPNCDSEGAAAFQHYYDSFDRAVQPVLSSPPSNGYFLDSCYDHCVTPQAEAWSQYTIDGSTIAEAVGDWYFGRSANTRLRDCAVFPCNPTCSTGKPGSSSASVRNMANPLAFITLFVMAFLAYI